MVFLHWLRRAVSPQEPVDKGSFRTPVRSHYSLKSSMGWKHPESDSRMQALVMRFTCEEVSAHQTLIQILIEGFTLRVDYATNCYKQST